MKFLVTIALTVLLSAAPFTTTFENCACTAEDGSCSASVSCRKGCVAVCPSGGCRASCSGGNAWDDSPVETIDMSKPVTLQLKGADGKQIASELARIVGGEVVFQPSKPDATFNLDVKNATLWDVLDILSASGTLRVAGDDFSRLQVIRKALISGERMTVCVRNASVKQIVKEFASLSGWRLRVTAGDEEAVINLMLKGVTLEDVLMRISEQTGVRITKE